jgi:hypothetical protein
MDKRCGVIGKGCIDCPEQHDCNAREVKSKADMDIQQHIKILEEKKATSNVYIKELQNEYGTNDAKINALISLHQKDVGALSFAIDLMQKVHDGLMVVLPCWGRVFIHSDGKVQEMEMCHYRGNTAGIYDMRCECTNQHEDCDSLCGNIGGEACAYNFRVAEIGKTVFLTKEAAIAAKEAAK